MVFADISGFTKMSERLARHGKVGAEEVTDAINTCFEQLLAIAYAAGGSLLKFGGDALLLLFAGDDHATRAAHAAVGMRHRLRTVGRLQTSSGLVVLRISIGVHSGTFHFFAIGDSHRELRGRGPGRDRDGRGRGQRDRGRDRDERGRPPRCFPRAAGARHAATGSCCARRRARRRSSRSSRATPGTSTSPRYVPIAIRAPPARRRRGLRAPQRDRSRSCTSTAPTRSSNAKATRCSPQRLDEVVRVVQAAADEHEVTLLGSDIDHDGGKLILVSGVPRRVGDDEQRMLTALRQIADTNLPIPLRIGAHTGLGVRGRGRPELPAHVHGDG